MDRSLGGEMTIALTGGRLIDGNGGNPVPDTNIIIEGEAIVKVGPAAQTPVPRGAQVISVAGKTVMPGLINCFIAMSGEAASDSADPYTRLPSYALLRGVVNARRLLDAGVTSCRVMGDPDYTVALKHAIDHGLVPGPRMVVGGYTLEPVGYQREWVPPAQYAIGPGRCTGPWEVRRAVRMSLLNGADYIKVNVGGAVGSNIPLSMETNNWTREELDAAADEAHSRGVVISADNCYADESVQACAEAGFDGVVHGGLITERGLEALVKHDMFIIPTLSAFHAYLGAEGEKHFPLWRVEKGRRVAEMLRKTWPKYVEMGVKVVGGSVGRQPGEEALELQRMVDYGMTPMQAIVANTKRGAETIRMLDRLGTLETGKLADLIVVDGDPLDDITTLQDRKKVQLVMKAGEIFRSDL